jgi:hypothetical protein
MTPDGGCTYDPRTDSEATSGYSVSTHKDREIVLRPEAVDPKTLLRFLVNNADLLRNEEGSHLGVWHNPEDKAYLDVSRVVADEAEARRLCDCAPAEGILRLPEGQVDSGRG